MVKPEKIDLKELAGNITINVELKRYKEFRIRFWIGIQLIKLASKIMWMNFRETKEGEWKVERVKKLEKEIETIIKSEYMNSLGIKERLQKLLEKE